MTDEERRREVASRTTYETIQNDFGWLAIATVDDRSCAAGGPTEAHAKCEALRGVAGPSNVADFVGHMVRMSAREMGYFEPDTCRRRDVVVPEGTYVRLENLVLDLDGGSVTTDMCCEEDRR